MLVLTLVGTDRPGLVDAVAKEIAALGGNWEESRMVRLAGQFAGVLLVTIETARTDELSAALRELGPSGLRIDLHPAQAHVAKTPAPPHYKLEVTGNDRPGIIRDISRILAERNANVEELESQVASAPMSGESMFTARFWFHLATPESTHLEDLRARLEALGGELMVDLTAL